MPSRSLPADLQKSTMCDDGRVPRCAVKDANHGSLADRVSRTRLKGLDFEGGLVNQRAKWLVDGRGGSGVSLSA